MTINALFVGGYMASEHDVTVWADSAKEQRPDLTVITIPWVIGASSTNPLARYGGIVKQWGQIISRWKDETYIIGHSSGAVVANEIFARTANKTKAHLICLDGFIPYENSRYLLTTQIWSAVYEDIWNSPVTHTYYSLNYWNIKGALTNNKTFHVYSPKMKCTKTWPLHFSLVNENSNDDHVTSIGMGYYDCKANLCWLPPA